MFGFVQADTAGLKEDDLIRYRSYYCGLCRSLGNKYGAVSRLCLTYDMAFLAMVLTSLYEPPETVDTGRCAVHPIRENKYLNNKYIDYCADMTIALMYHKLMDNWKDDRNIASKISADTLKNKYEKVKSLWPNQCSVMERELKTLSEIEKEPDFSADEAGACFGRLMASLFTVNRDNWYNHLNCLGYELGRFIYVADAVLDLDDDIKKNKPNPFKNVKINYDDMKNDLKIILGGAARAFEFLPLVQDYDILRNVIYNGIWLKYNSKISKQDKNNTQQGEK